MTISSGTKLGRYEIRSKIGEGGMGEVYLAEDTKLERTVALKILPADVAQDQQRMRRFVQEAKAASALNHPNILTIHEVGEDAGINFIATEFIEGKTLRQRMKSARMKLGEVLDVAVQSADALSAAHEAGIIHRDIKPENIMLRRRDAYVKVLDFGLAKLIEQPPVAVDTEAPTKTLLKTDAGVVMGTVIYMSPEQARGLEVDARTDIWSLGAVLYEMVAGCMPFEGSTTSEILASILNEKEPPPLARFAREVPAELERIVEKALRKDREQRYQTAKDLLLDLRRLKHKLEVDAEIERSVAPEVFGVPPSGGPVTDAKSSPPEGGTPNAHPTTSVEYIVTEIKRRKRGALLILVALVAVTAAVAYFAYWRSAGGGGAGTIRSIAVLPFTNADGNPDAEYLSDGISESLINSLSQLPGIKVIARSSSFRYKGKEVDPQEVANALGVEAILTGRVVQRGDNLLISAELVNASDKTHVWGDQYNRKLSDVLAVQSEIAREISQKLRLKLTGDEQHRVTRRYTDDTEAHSLYIKGRYYLNRLTDDGFRKGLEYFQQAIDKDSNYALAYAGLADSYNTLGSWNALPPNDVFPKARAAAMKALEIDDLLAEAHTSLGTVKLLYDWDWPGAERELKRAIEINPSYSDAHQMYGYYLSAMGRFDEALAEMRHAQELDPLSLVKIAGTGEIFYYQHQYDRAIEQYQKALEMDPNSGFAHWALGNGYVQKGMYGEAIAEYQKAIPLSGDSPDELASLGYAYALSGKSREARRVIDELKERSKRRYISPTVIAFIYTGLGEKDQAFALLDKAYDGRDFILVLLKVEPMFDGLRPDPRFANLLRRVGLAP